jgi:uncharacterized protein
MTSTRTLTTRASIVEGTLEAVDRGGFGVTAEPLLTPDECAGLRALWDELDHFRKTVEMGRVRFGEGTYRYFRHPMPPLVAALRTATYAPLAALASEWATRLGQPRFPEEHEAFLERCTAAGQTKATPLLLRYGTGGYNCLHQDLYGEVAFPLQITVALSEVGVDHTGGESVFVEQRPRAQSRAFVTPVPLGHAVVFATNERPAAGTRGYHRVRLRHGVATVTSGARFALGIIYHDAR